MIEFTSAKQIKLNSGACIDADSTDEELGVRALVGYHNYFRVGVFDAVDIVNEAAKKSGLSGWRAGYCRPHEPFNGVRVGQVRVHSGDNKFILFVQKQ